MARGRGTPPGGRTGSGSRSPRHAEERPKGASRSTHDRSASFETPSSRAPQDDELGGSKAALHGAIKQAIALPPGLVLLGEFGRAHGLKGEVRLKSHTGDPLAIGTYGPLTAADGRTIVLGPLRRAPGEAPDMLVARVEGVTDRDGAEALNRLELHCPRERLGEADADEDEFFLADLIGLDAVAEDGTAIGPIVAVPNYGGGDLLEIAPPVGPTLLVPFTKAFVPVLDIANRRVTVAADALVADVESGGTDETDQAEA